MKHSTTNVKRSNQLWQKAGTALCFSLSFIWISAAQATPIEKQEANSANPAVHRLSSEELVDLVGPIALFPDDLLALTLEAASHPVQIVSANRMKKDKQRKQKINPQWDESVVALLNYPEVLDMLDRDIEWTERLGQAEEEQSDELMQAITQFRNEAHQSGNLQTDSYQIVSVDDDQITIRHKNKEKIYVPYYDHKKVTKRQSRNVYHYYPNAYPVYYYPYESSYYFDRPFYGIDSIFGLSWSEYRISRYSHSHFLHPYYGRTYHPNHFRRSQIFPSLQKKLWIRTRNRERDRSKWNQPNDRTAYTLGDKNQTAHQKTLIDRERARNRANSLESDRIMSPPTSFRILDRDRSQRNNQTLNKNGNDSFRSLGKQKIMLYQGPTKIERSNRIEPRKSAKINQNHALK